LKGKGGEGASKLSFCHMGGVTILSSHLTMQGGEKEGGGGGSGMGYPPGWVQEKVEGNMFPYIEMESLILFRTWKERGEGSEPSSGGWYVEEVAFINISKRVLVFDHF